MERDEGEIGAELEAYGEFLPEVLDKMERELATSAWSMWEGFSAFCRNVVGVDAEKVAAVILEPVGDRIKGLQARAERLGVETDAETVEEIREGLREGLAASWRGASDGQVPGLATEARGGREGETMTLVCPECGAEFVAYGDVPLEFIVHEWVRETGEAGHHETPESILRIFAYEHDPAALVEKTSGLPFLSREISGIDIGARRPEAEAGVEGGA